MSGIKKRSAAEAKALLGDIDWQTATGSARRDLQIHLINEVSQSLWLPEGLSEGEYWGRIKAACAALEGIKPEGEVESVTARLRPPSRVERCSVAYVVIGVVTDVVTGGGCCAGRCGVGAGASAALDG